MINPQHLSWINFDTHLCLLSTIKTIQWCIALHWNLVFGFMLQMSSLHATYMRPTSCFFGKFDFLVLFALCFCWCFPFGDFQKWFLGAFPAIFPLAAAFQNCSRGPIFLGWAPSSANRVMMVVRFNCSASMPGFLHQPFVAFSVLFLVLSMLCFLLVRHIRVAAVGWYLLAGPLL